MPRDFSYMYPVFPIVGSISIFMCMISVPVHMKVGNIAVVSLALWTSIGLLILVIDTCIWHGNIRNPYPIWGDIVQQYLTMMPVGLATCTLCIQYRLWSVAQATTVFITKRERKLRIFTTCFFCFGIPIIVGAIHYVSQGHRYDLFEDLGPFITTYNTPVSLSTYSIWEPLFCFISGIYAIHTLALFLARRKEMDVALSSGSININKNRYIRLMCLAMVAFGVHFPISAWIFIANCTMVYVYPWISWDDTHFNYSRIRYITRLMVSLTPKYVILASINWWSLVLCGFNFFIFFGLGEEATKQYRFWIRSCLRAFGVDYSRNKSGDEVQRTWLDVLLCRPGRPVFSKPDPGHVVPHFSVDMAETTSYDYEGTSISSRIDADHVAADSTNLESLHPTRENPHSSNIHENAMKMTRKTIYTGEDAAFDVPTDVPNHNESDIFNEKRNDERLPPSPSTELKREVDLEAQRSFGISVEEQRRKEMLEKNPELTEEVFF